MATPIPIDLVIFDLIGTTVLEKGAVQQCLIASLDSADLKVDPDAVQEVLGLPEREMVRLLVGRFNHVGHRLDQVDTILKDFLKRLSNHFRYNTNVTEVPGTSAVFARLQKAGIAVAINSEFHRELTDIPLRKMSWASHRLLDSTMADDEVQQGRPHPDMIQALMERIGIADPARVAKVGDTAADLIEGQNAGCGLIVGVTGGSQSQEHLQGHPHSYLIDSVAEFPGLLNLS